MGLGLTVVVLVVFLSGVFYAINADLQPKTAETPVVIESIEETEWTDDGELIQGWDISYSYEVEGEIVRGHDDRNEWYETGDELKICYNPNDLSSHSLTRIDNICGAGIFG